MTETPKPIMSLKLLPEDLQQTEICNDVGDTIQHVFDSQSIEAVNAALAINRPLLIKGEPGIGKSQLAKAVAQELGRVFIPFVADVHTESRDLLWEFDAVARLAEAQIQSPQNPDKEALALKNFIVPKALWWALNWEDAEKFVTQKVDDKGNKTYRHQPPFYPEKCHPTNGCVVLIDEIDKTNTDVPNGLLEALGNHRFHPQGLDQAVEASGVPPLVIITSNAEQQLPDAFIRRCLTLHMHFPKSDEDRLDFLVKRGKVNFPDLAKEKINSKNQPDQQSDVLTEAATMLLEDRRYAEQHHLKPFCGQAEYFDLLRGVEKLHEQGRGSHQELMDQLRVFTYQKLIDKTPEDYSA